MARIIFADDDDLIGEIVVDALSNAGHAVGWLKNGKAALDAMVRRPPNIAILDRHMPVMSGNSVVREMRLNKDLLNTPVLMLTASAGLTDQEISFYDGADDYMTKPFDPDELVFRVEELIKSKSAPKLDPLRGQ